MRHQTERMKAAIRIHYKGRCQYCGATGAIHVDHVMPLTRGGTDSIENLTLACQSCNARKHATELDPMFLAIAHARARDAAPAILTKALAADSDGGAIIVRSLKSLGGSANQIGRRIQDIGRAGLELRVEDQGWDTRDPDGIALFIAGNALAAFFENARLESE